MIGPIELPIPPSANRMYRKVRNMMIPAPEYLHWLEAAAPIVRRHITGHLATPITVHIKVWSGKGWRENSDLDNLEKPIKDMLQAKEFGGRQLGAAVLESDDCRHVRYGTHEYIDREDHAWVTGAKKKDLVARLEIYIESYIPWRERR